jgi:hypothetical protein
LSDRPRSDIHLGEYHAIDDQSVFVHRANFVLFLTVKGQGTDEVRVRWLLAPAGTQGDQAFIHCVYEVMDVQVDVDDLQLVPVSVLQCPVKMSARRWRDTPVRRRRAVRTDYPKTVAAIEHCIQRFTGELMSESDDEIPFTVSQRDAARANGVLPSKDEVHLQKQQLGLAEQSDLY